MAQTTFRVDSPRDREKCEKDRIVAKKCFKTMKYWCDNLSESKNNRQGHSTPFPKCKRKSRMRLSRKKCEQIKYSHLLDNKRLICHRKRFWLSKSVIYRQKLKKKMFIFTFSELRWCVVWHHMREQCDIIHTWPIRDSHSWHTFFDPITKFAISFYLES